MADDKYVLGKEAIRQLQRDHQTKRHQLRKMNEAEAAGKAHDPSKGGGGRRREFVTGLTMDDIQSADDSAGRPTFGSGPVKIHNVTLQANTGRVLGQDAGWEQVDVYNMGPKIRHNWPVFLYKCFQTGQWLVNDWSYYFTLFTVTVEITPADSDANEVGVGQGKGLIKETGGVATVDSEDTELLYNVTEETIPVGTMVRAIRDPVTKEYIVEGPSPSEGARLLDTGHADVSLYSFRYRCECRSETV